MERFAWDIHQVLRELYALSDEDGKINYKDIEQQQCQTKVTNMKWNEGIDDGGITNSRCLFSMRRIFRRLDRVLQMLESEIIRDCQTSYQAQQILDGNIPLEKGSIRQENLDSNRDTDMQTDDAARQYVDFQGTNRTSDPVGFTQDSTSSGTKTAFMNVEKVENLKCTRTIPNDLQEDLLEILINLPFPTQDENTFRLASSVLETTMRIWNLISQQENFGHDAKLTQWMISYSRIITLVERIIEYGVHNKHRLYKDSNEYKESPEYQHDQHINSNSFLIPLITWLEIVNNYFTRLEDDELQNGSRVDGIVGEPPQYGILPVDLFRFLPSFLEQATKSVQLKPWESSGLYDPVVEVHVQWRILTDTFMDKLMSMYQHEQPLNPTASSVFSFLTDGFHHLMKCTAMLNYENDNSYECDGDERQQITNQVHDFLMQVTIYALELVDYALDSLDGAAVLNFTPTNKSNMTVNAAAVQGQEANFFTKSAIHDCLRHSTLAINLLVVIQFWYENKSLQHSQLEQAKRNLWKAMSSAFMENSNKRKLQNTQDFGARLCHSQILLTNLILSNPRYESTTSYDDNSTLILIFLRALEYPELLLSENADTLWQVFEKQIRFSQEHHTYEDSKEKELKHVLQAAYITIMNSNLSMLPHSSSLGKLDRVEDKRQQNQNLLKRMIMLLKMPNIDNTITLRNENTAQADQELLVTQKDPWDEFFLQQLSMMTL